MGATVLRKKLTDVGRTDIEVQHASVSENTWQIAQIVVTPPGAFSKEPERVHLTQGLITISNFMAAPEYDSLAQELKALNTEFLWNLHHRIRQIILYLLGAEQPATDQEVADALGVSKRTILREADYIASILKQYDLTLVRKKGEGSQIEGDADNKARLMSAVKSPQRMRSYQIRRREGIF